MYFRYAKNEMETVHLPIGNIFPFISRYRLINPYKANYSNKISLENTLRKFLKDSTDTTSVYMQVLLNKILKYQNGCHLLGRK